MGASQVTDPGSVGKGHLVPHDVDRLNGTTSQLSKRGRDLLRAPHLYGVQGQTQSRRGTPQHRQVRRDPVARVPVPQHRHVREPRLSVLQQLQHLSCHVRRDIPRQARDVASGPSEARHQTRCHRITRAGHDDREGAGRIPCGGRRRIGTGDDQLHLRTDQVGGKVRKPAGVVPGPAPFDGDGFPFEVAKALQSVAERLPARPVACSEDADTMYAASRLCLGGERRGEKRDDQHDQRRDSRHRSIPPNSASAFSSQKLMSISRYIVAAVVRCSWAFAWSPVRR